MYVLEGKYEMKTAQDWNQIQELTKSDLLALLAKSDPSWMYLGAMDRQRRAEKHKTISSTLLCVLILLWVLRRWLW